MATCFKYFGVLKFVGVPKPMHGFSLNFHYMLTERESRADEVLEGIWQQLLPWQCFKYFSVLNFSIEKGALLNRCNYNYIFISRVGLGDYMYVCICQIFTSIFICHSFMKIPSPNLQRMFMALKHACEKFCPHFKKKKHGRHSRLFKNH